MSNMRDYGFSGGGTLYMKRLDRPDLGFLEVGNATSLSVSMSAEVKERISKKRENYGAVLDTLIIPKAAELKITLDTFTNENLAMLFMGSLAKGEMKAQTIADEIVNGQVGRWLQVAHGYIKSGSLQVKDASGNIIPSDNVQINERMGFFRLDDSVPINTGDKLKVNYETADLKQWVIQANTESQVKCALMLDGKNRVNNDDVQLIIDKATLSPDGGFDIFSDDFNQRSMTGRPEVAEGKDAPFTIRVKENA